MVLWVGVYAESFVARPPTLSHDPAKILGRRASCFRSAEATVEHTLSSRAWRVESWNKNEKRG
jgi:hypothetical protein